VMKRHGFGVARFARPSESIVPCGIGRMAALDCQSVRRASGWPVTWGMYFRHEPLGC